MIHYYTPESNSCKGYVFCQHEAMARWIDRLLNESGHLYIGVSENISIVHSMAFSAVSSRTRHYPVVAVIDEAQTPQADDKLTDYRGMMRSIPSPTPWRFDLWPEAWRARVQKTLAFEGASLPGFDLLEDPSTFENHRSSFLNALNLTALAKLRQLEPIGPIRTFFRKVFRG